RGAQHLFDFRIASTALQRDHIAVRQLALRTAFGWLQGNEFLTEQAGLPDSGSRVRRHRGITVDLQRDFGVPARELNIGDPSDGHIVDAYSALRNKVQYIAELRLDRVRLFTGVGSAGQRQRVWRE